MNRPTRSITLIFVVAVLGFSVADADAQLTGSTVNVSAYYPDSSSVYDNPGNRIVSAGIEYPVGSYSSYNSSFQVNVTDTQLIISLPGSSTFFLDASFNGFVLNKISGLGILAASIDPSSTFSPVSLTVENGARILANYQGVDTPLDASSIINITLVPEPATVGLLGLSLVILSLHIRRR